MTEFEGTEELLQQIRDDTSEMSEKLWYTNSKFDTLLEQNEKLIALLSGSRLSEASDEDEPVKTKKTKKNSVKKPKKKKVDEGGPYNWSIEQQTTKDGTVNDEYSIVKYTYNAKFAASLKKFTPTWKVQYMGHQFPNNAINEVVETLCGEYQDWTFDDKRPAAMIDEDEDDEDSD